MFRNKQEKNIFVFLQLLSHAGINEQFFADKCAYKSRTIWVNLYYNNTVMQEKVMIHYNETSSLTALNMIYVTNQLIMHSKWTIVWQ